VSVPALETEAESAPVVAPAVNVAPSSPEPTPTSASPLRSAGLVAGAAGVVGLGVGTVFGVLAVSKKSDADSSGCNGDQCTASAATTRDGARSDANVSTVAFVVGALLAAGGVTAWLLAPRSDAPLAVVPSAGPNDAGLLVRGTF
jgi:serine/threonine-protein kinase